MADSGRTSNPCDLFHPQERLGDFRFVVGIPRVIASSPGVERSFCGQCGTPLTYRHATFAEEVDVTTGSLYDPDEAAPAHHTWTLQKLAWVRLADGLPEHPRTWSEPSGARAGVRRVPG